MMGRVIPFILYLLLIAMWQQLFYQWTEVYQARVDLAGLIVVLVALHKSEMVSVWFGFAAGLVLAVGLMNTAGTETAAVESAHLGWHGPAAAVLALAVYHVRNRLNLESVRSRLLVVFGGVAVHYGMIVLITGTVSSLYRFAVVVLSGAVYATVLGWVFFLFKDRIITYQKIKALF
ncbi:MAG: hypothetical protein AB1744_01800 [Candidatus Zixiibacteriota bacterium]